MSTPYYIALAVACVACFTDLRSRRIPNVLTFGTAIGGVLFHAITGGVDGLLLAAAGCAIGLVIFFVPFALGGLGAGDVKLLGALGTWLGPAAALWVALYAGIAGGVLALVVALSHGYLRRALSNISLLLTHWRVAGIRPLHEVSLDGSAGPRLAYAVPVLCGVVGAIWLR
jgi:prepilin peptidase CpaA